MRKGLVFPLIAALFLGACSNEPSPEEDPKAALVSAFESLAELDASTITLSIQSTPESLTAASEGTLTPEQADTILGSRVVFSGNQPENPEDANGRIAVTVPGTEGFELLIIGTDLYVRADVRGFVELAGEDPAQIDQFLQSPQAQQASFLEPAVNGEFIHIEGADQLGAAAGADPGQLTEQQQQLLEQFGNSIEREAEVTSEGSDDVGDHLVVSIPLRALVRQFTDFASEVGAPLPPGSFPPESEVPEGDVTMDVWIADGRVVQMEFDVVRLAQEFGGDLPEGLEEMRIRIELSDEAEEVTAPEGATTVTADQLMGLLFSGITGSDSAGGDTGFEEPGTGESPGGDLGGEFDCSVYKDLPPETFDGLPPETLQQLEQLCPGVVPGQ